MHILHVGQPEDGRYFYYIMEAADDQGSGQKVTLSHTMFGWDLITRQGQAIATGLYLYSVEDHTNNNKYTVGKFLVVKSDREAQ